MHQHAHRPASRLAEKWMTRQPDDQVGAGLREPSRHEEAEHRQRASACWCQTCPRSWRLRSERGCQDKNLKIQVLHQDTSTTTRGMRSLDVHAYTCTYMPCMHMPSTCAENTSKATYKSSSTTSTTPDDQIPRRTTTTLPRKSEAVRATPTMQVLLPLQHHVPSDTDEANDAGGHG